MKATELRIGNWAKRDVQPNGFQIDHHSFWSCEREPENYTPIPLTEQWLKDFGFKQDTNWLIKWSGELKFRMCVEDKNVWTYIYHDGYIEVDIKYVHQLQNLYFALTKKELTKS